MNEQVAVFEGEKKVAVDIEYADTEICRKKDFTVIDEQSNIEKEQADVYDAMMSVLERMRRRKRWKIRCGIWAEGGDSSDSCKYKKIFLRFEKIDYI